MMKTKMKKFIAFICAIAIVATSVTVWNQASPVEAAEDTTSTENTPVYLAGFKHITTTSFVDSDDADMKTTFASGAVTYTMKNIEGTLQEGKNSFNRTLLSLMVNFGTGDTAEAHDQQIGVLGKNRTDYFRISPNKSGNYLNITPQGSILADGSTTPIQLAAVTAFGDDTTGFRGTDFLLQISFEQGNYDEDSEGTKNDLKLGFYINGKLYNEDHNYFYNCNMDDYFGPALSVYVESSSGSVTTINPVIPENDNLTHITWSDFVKRGAAVGEETTTLVQDKSAHHVYSLHNKFGSEYDHMGNTSFEVKMTFNGDSITQETRFQYAGDGSNGQGICMRPVASSQALSLRYIADVKPTISSNSMNMSPTDADCWNQEFTLKVTTEFGDYDGDGDTKDVQMGFYVNGILGKNQYLYAYDVENDFGRYIYIKVNDITSLTIKSVEEERDPYVTLDGFRNITASSFVNNARERMMEGRYEIEGENTNNVQTYHLKNALDGKLIDSYDKTLLSLNLTFADNGSASRIEVLGADGIKGFYINPMQSGKWLSITSIDNIAGVWQQRYIKAVDLDTTLTDDAASNYFVNRAFTLQISFDYGDFEEDGLSNDLKLGIYYNGEQCNLYDGTSGESSNIIYNCDMTQIGSYLTVRVEGQPITIESFDPTAPNGPGKEFHDLAISEYTLPSSGAIKVNGDEITEDTLTLSGEYTIAVDDTVVANVIIYEAGHANLDGEGKLDVRDLVATLKLSAGQEIVSTDKAAALGADANNNGAVTDNDVKDVRSLLMQ